MPGPAARVGDLVLPVAVVAVVGMMIFPLPNAVLDILLTGNMAFALCLLISSVYLLEPSKFTSLPTVLLLATLFRLGLNISTTRQVLAHGDAPEIVKAFGSFVVGGNLVVGFVVFAIVTLVQFLVIAKGAERVAEVAARFTLDALPGKQMSIDADVRAGIITVSEAKERRSALQRESKLYGALDGAMKFVKGDAIAGLVITVVNILAGLVVGVTQHGMSLGVAGRTYTLFTIGDGLVSQIPALLVAVAAGVVVTRVEDRDQAFVGRELFSQLGREPQAVFTTGVVLLVLALVPGLPAVPFTFAGVFLLLLSWRGKRSKQQAREQSDLTFSPKVFSPIVIKVTPTYARLLQAQQRIPAAIQGIRNSVFAERGVIIPEINFDLCEEREELAGEIQLHGVVLQRLSIEDSLEQVLESCILSNLERLIDDTLTRTLIELNQAQAEDLINSLIPQAISVTGLTTLLRQLVREGVVIRELRLILQAVAEFHLAKSDGLFVPRLPAARGAALFRELKALGAGGTAQGGQNFDLRELLGEVRLALSQTICQSLGTVDGRLAVYLLAPITDRALAQGAFANTPVDPALADHLLEQIRNLRDGLGERPLIVLTSKAARLYCAELVLSEVREAKVLAVDELASEITLDILGYLGGEGANDYVQTVAA